MAGCIRRVVPLLCEWLCFKLPLVEQNMGLSATQCIDHMSPRHRIYYNKNLLSVCFIHLKAEANQNGVKLQYFSTLTAINQLHDLE